MRLSSAIRRDRSFPSVTTLAPGKRGFTLLEFVGVLAILAIVAALVTPSVIQMIERQIRQAEDETLNTIREAILKTVRQERLVPGTDWVADIAPHSELNEGAVEYNGRDNQRKILIDPNFFDSMTSSRPAVVYDQDNDPLRTEAPNSPRLIVVSSVGPPLPSASDMDFANVWSTADGELPSTSSPWDTWSGDGDDLRIQRVDLRDQFHEILLDKLDGASTVGYEIEGRGILNEIYIDTSVNFYLLRETQVKLFEDSSRVTTITVDEKKSYYYDEEMWTSELLNVGNYPWISSIMTDLRYWVIENGYDPSSLSVSTNSSFEVTE